MERFIQKEQVLLGYTSRQSFSSPKVPFRNSSDVDFKDVFGGPPRRSSVQDWRHLGEASRDSNLSREEEVGESKTNSSLWSGLSDKPVFGEENLNRRRYPSDDFFVDIFRGEESSSSTPRKPSRDAFSSTPGSRVQSPSRTLPYHSDPFGSSSSLPPVLSLPTKLAKDIEYPTFASPSRSPYKNNENAPNGLGFPSSPSVLSSRRSNQDMQGQGGFRNDLRSFYRQSTLSKELSLDSNGLSQVTKSDKHDSENHFKKNSSSSEVSDTNWQFHFSIYKWASTEVPIVMPLREGSSVSLKGRDKPEERMTEFVAPVLEGSDLPSIGDIVLPMNSGNQDENSVPHIKKDRTNSSEVVEVVVSAKPASESLFQLNNVLKEVQSNLPSQNSETEIKRGSSAPDAALNRSLSEKTEKKTSVSKKKGQKLEQGPLYCLLKDECDKRGNDKATEQAKEGKERKTPVLKKKTHEQEPNPLYCLMDDSERQGYSKAAEQGKPKEGNMKSMHTVAGDVENSKKGKKKTGKRNFLNDTEATNSTLQDFFPEEKLVSNKVKGKVKDFVKIFNRESPSKPITTAEVPKKNASAKDNGADRASAVKHSGADREDAGKDSGADRPEDQENVPANEADRKGKVDNIQKRISDTSGSVDQILKHSENLHFGVTAASHKISGTSSKRDDNSASCSETRSESVGVRSGNVEESHYPDLNCTVKELSQDQFKQPQNDQSPEDFQVWDAKIRKWSSGKEGNIRSLLSTLQYVLWPESGWKPVPLVDIIEGNPVKRAYQKALLCLHPDKLQQKGAAPHQKYIAEKVFDILQDAWTHFNTMGSF